ncbi:hypothetical protein QCA50_003290 [Cerrena zonata]|uniref:Cyclin-D1-binding protein 1 n=1 Tax=Cerrena zonata TaxID=2478898 RepID=A0AAW0GJ84_9APHY
MSDIQKVLVVLSLLSETCSANLIPLQQTPSRPSSSANAPSHALPVLRKDFLSLLTLVYNLSTKIALTLRPSEPAYTASLTPIQELTKHISSLTTCATLFDEHGVTLAKEVRQSAQDVCEAAKALSQTFITITKNSGESSSSSSGGNGEDYLMRTGAIHEVVEKIKRELSEDNVAAVRKRYAMDVGLLEDTVKEVAEMIEDSEGSEDDEDDEGFEDEDFDDELGELGLGSTKRLSTAEVERVKKIQPLFRMSTLLHKRIMLDLLKKGHTYPSDYSQRADSLLETSHSLLLAHEEVVAVLYAPQKPSTISEAIAELASCIVQAQNTLIKQKLLPPSRDPGDIAELEKMSAAAISGDQPTGAKKERDVRKWFDTCFEQLGKLCGSIVDNVASDPVS